MTTPNEFLGGGGVPDVGTLPIIDLSWIGGLFGGIVWIAGFLFSILLIPGIIVAILLLFRYVLPKFRRIVIYTKPNFIYYLTSGRVVEEPNQWVIQDGKKIPNPAYEGDAVGYVSEGDVDQVVFWSPDFELRGRYIVPKERTGREEVKDLPQKALDFFGAPFRGLKWIGFWKRLMPVQNRWDKFDTVANEKGELATKIVHKSRIEWAAPGFVTKFAKVIVGAEDLSGRRINVAGNLLIRITDAEKARFSNPDGNRQTVDAAEEAINACIKKTPVFDNMMSKAVNDWLGDAINKFFQDFEKVYTEVDQDGNPISKPMKLREWCNTVCGYDILGFIISSIETTNPEDAELLVAKENATIAGDTNVIVETKKSDAIKAGLPGRIEEAEMYANHPQVVLASMFGRGTGTPSGQPAAPAANGMDEAAKTFSMMMQMAMAEKFGWDFAGMFSKKKERDASEANKTAEEKKAETQSQS